MDTVIIALLVVIGALLAFVLYTTMKRQNGTGDNDKLAAMMERLTMLGEQNKELRVTLDEKLAQTHKVSQDQYGKTVGIMQNVTAETQKALNAIHSQSQKVIADVTEKLTKLDETNKQVVGFSAQLQGLQDILKNPKQRGILGEFFLEQTLQNVLPTGSFAIQYKLGHDKKLNQDLIVDAAVFVGDKVIPVDSKFSLENYERILATTDPAERERLEKVFKQDLKNRIDETSKYIRPEFGTFDFAFMFIPSEAIYYDLLVNTVGAVKVSTQDLIEYAFRDKKVIIVSPTSFLAYLQTVLQGLKAMQIEENAKEIRSSVEALGKHLLVYDDFMQKLGVSMRTTVNHYNAAYKEFVKVDKDVLRITGEDRAKVEPLLLEKPEVVE